MAYKPPEKKTKNKHKKKKQKQPKTLEQDLGFTFFVTDVMTHRARNSADEVFQYKKLSRKEKSKIIS